MPHRRTGRNSTSRNSVNGPLLRRAFAREAESRLRLARPQDAARNILADRGSVFESMAGSAAREPDVRRRRMLVEKKISVRRVLVLADARFDQRRILHP